MVWELLQHPANAKDCGEHEMVDEQTFVAEVRDMERTLYRVARGYLRSADECADAVQEALCKAWNKRQTVAPERFRPWLTRIVINECHNIGRRKKRVQPMADVEPPEPISAPDLADELSSLPEKLRTPLLLHYLEGFSVKEVAALVHRPCGTVQNRLFRAREALRKLLGEEMDV